MQKKTLKTTTAALAVGLLMTSVLAGCGSKNENDNNGGNASPSNANGTAAAGEGKLDPVELTWYFDGTPQADIASVEEAMNKILKEKINATIHLKAIDWGNYDQKMQLVNASGERYDLAFTSSWANNYYTNVNKGAFIALDDLLPKYAPNIMKTIPDLGWNAVKVKGSIYAVPNYQIWASTNGIAIQKDVAAKYGFDIASVKKFTDIEPLLASVKANEPGLVPFENDKGGRFGSFNVAYGFDSIAGSIPGIVGLQDTSLKVLNQFETTAYKEYLATMRDWFQKGYVRKDAATLSDTSGDRKAGKPVVVTEGNVKPGGEVEMTGALGGKQVVDVKLSEPYLLTSSIISTMTGVSKTSKNPERAVMFLDLLFSDKELFNILAHGIEGKHYTKVDENTVDVIKEGGYDPNTDWEFGNQFNGFYRKGQEPGIWDETIKINETAKASPLLGFSFDPTPVKTEIAQLSTVTSQYVPLLDTGAVDPDKMLPEFVAKLKTAGVDRVIAEEQKQIDAWKASK
ncbi:ABC transporter substrate-binding protein [Paenibacillus sacheonensis]|uniref:Extracellular solute-binding protein n=1 Tax=Paenibacillus sacheonensis TaxID=742054 RepID=A0A7X5BXT6_9BACL|nr:ABC transporter substrate-binding protein [Paenibacillus sacheonensis]MBM7565925.1 putative aldouronate transport system substrate-binding protein [Paenibacillus sacheonensis]NBC68761.1 extracellular solute-binding protein [Paenibacillus sacheonensis]